MSDGKPRSAVDLLRERLGTADDDVIARLGEEQFPEKLPAQEVSPPEPSPPQAAPEPEELSREDFLRYHLRKERNPEMFEKVTEKMRAWAALHPVDERKWDTDYAAFNKAYDSFQKDILRTEHRLAGHSHPLRFKDEIEAEKAAEAARNSVEAKIRAEREEDERLRADLKAAYSRNDQMAANEILEKLAERVLRS